MLQVGLEEQPLHLQTFGLLQGLDLVEGKFEGAAGCQPRLEQSELGSRRSGVGVQAQPPTTVVFLQRDGAEADDEVRQGLVCLRFRPYQTSRALLRAHLHGQRENRQFEALAGSGAPLSGRIPAVSKVEETVHPPRKALQTILRHQAKLVQSQHRD